MKLTILEFECQLVVDASKIFPWQTDIPKITSRWKSVWEFFDYLKISKSCTTGTIPTSSLSDNKPILIRYQDKIPCIVQFLTATSYPVNASARPIVSGMMRTSGLIGLKIIFVRTRTGELFVSRALKALVHPIDFTIHQKYLRKVTAAEVKDIITQPDPPAFTLPPDLAKLLRTSLSSSSESDDHHESPEKESESVEDGNTQPGRVESPGEQSGGDRETYMARAEMARMQIMGTTDNFDGWRQNELLIEAYAIIGRSIANGDFEFNNDEN